MSTDDQPLDPDAIKQRLALAFVAEQLHYADYATCPIFYAIGKGGIGKSHLLREAKQIADQIRASSPQRLLETGIIDLAHTRYQQPLWFMYTLARRLTRSVTGDKPDASRFFAAFKSQADQYVQQTRGMIGPSPDQLAAVRSSFLQSYHELAAQQPVVLLLDTLERLDPVMDEVQGYNFRTLNRFEDWLLDLIAALPNTLTVLAGRARPQQITRVTQRLGSRITRRLWLQPFDPDETRDYMERHGYTPDAIVWDNYDDLNEWYAQMHDLSEGHPVKLIVAIEFAKSADFDINALPPDLGDFVNEFIAKIQTNNPELGDFLAQATYLRRGLSRDLLQYLNQQTNMGRDASTLEAHFTSFSQHSFVKRSGDDLMMLHDDVYDLFWQKLAPTSADSWLGHTIAYLDQRLEVLNATIIRDGLTIERMAQLRTYQIDRIAYQMSREPLLQGYQDYHELAYSAILGHDEVLDLQLQEELARFFDPETVPGSQHRQALSRNGLSWQHLVFDEAVRWVFRRLHSYAPDKDHNQLAIELAERIANDYEPWLADHPLARAALEVAQLEAEAPLHTQVEAVKQIRQRYAAVTETLRSIVAQPHHAEQAANSYETQQARFFLAYALNNWGYRERVQQHLASASQHYREAIRLYRYLGPETTTLRGMSLNNLAFALYLEGELDLARIYAEQAAQLQHQAGHRYREAAAYNTLTLVHLELNDVLAAEKANEQTRTLLSDYPNSRNQAFQRRGEGELARWLGFRDSAKLETSQQHFVRALDAYDQAQTFYTNRLSERERLAEIEQGRGCTYRSRGRALRLANQDGSADLALARTCFQTALSYCPEGLPLRAEIIEDLALTLMIEQRYAEALDWLEQASQAIPPRYQLDPPLGETTEEEEEIRRFWLQRAQIELQRAVCTVELHQPDAVIGEHLLRAFAALLRFSSRAQQLATFRLVARNSAIQLGDPQRIKALRQATYRQSQRLQARDAFIELNRLLLEAEELTDLLGQMLSDT
ncbi:MAG: hypothetical protein AB4911_03420 [Oscillochloridaceae bacterium umkhey_bin13]